MTEVEFQSAIERLASTIERLRKRGEAIGEEDTKRVLITPLLQTLGWDVHDVEEVRNEYRYQSGHNPVDYAMFTARTPCLFIEAKSLGTSLEDPKWILQTIAYAAGAGVAWCVLTNGDEYRLYNATAPVDADGKRFRTVQLSAISERDFTVQTLKLLSKSEMEDRRLNVLWNGHFVDRRVKAALEGLFRGQDENLVRLIQRKTDGLSPNEIRQSLKRVDIRLDFPVVNHPPDQRLTTLDNPIPVVPGANGKESGVAQHYGVTVNDLIAVGLIRPPFELTATWRNQPFTANIQADGSILFGSERYTSLSVSAGQARNIANGKPPDGRSYWQTNGWIFWKYRDDETGRIEVLDRLRRRFLQSNGSTLARPSGSPAS